MLLLYLLKYKQILNFSSLKISNQFLSIVPIYNTCQIKLKFFNFCRMQIYETVSNLIFKRSFLHKTYCKRIVVKFQKINTTKFL